MQPVGLAQVLETIQKALGNWRAPGELESLEKFLWPALDQFPEFAPLWFYAGCYLSLTGRHALAIRAYEKSYELQPNPTIWTDIGASYRCMNRVTECRVALKRGLEAMPEDPQLLTNLAGSYVNEGEPWTGIGYGEKALARDVNEKTIWNLALLYLEAGVYDKGFDFYAEGKHHHREERIFEPDPPKLTPQLHEALKGRGVPLIVYGEQGLGDELMLATMLPDVAQDYEVIFECHPRLEWLHRHSRHGDLQILPTRKHKGAPAERLMPQADAKSAIGDLCRFYRRRAECFTWNTPVYHADVGERNEYRQYLEAFAGGRKIIGLATRGGEISTNTHYRRLPRASIERLFSREDCLFVGLDYEDMTELVEFAREKFGPERYVWSAAINFHWEYSHVAALIAATDAVITVPQSVMHLSAGLGHPTEVLVQSKPDWRMGQTGSRWVWYPGDHCTLHRQVGNDWDTVIDSAMAAIDQRFLQRRVA